VLRRAVDAYVERFADYGPKVRWQGEDGVEVSFRARGLALRGRLALEPGCIALELKVPLALRPLAGRARGVLEREVRHWITAAERDEI